MNVEILKIRKELLPNGSEGQILDIEDFKRLITTYKLTLKDFIAMGLSRVLWKNTLLYYNLDVNDIQGLRIKTQNKHLSSYSGFSTKIPIKNLRLSISANDTKVENLLSIIDKYFKGTKDMYSKYHNKPEEVSRFLGDIKRELLEINEAVRYINRRVTKWAKKEGKVIKPLIHSKLEHHFAKILDELGLKYTPQFSIRNYHFDFKLDDYDILIEVDGGLHNTENDKAKNKLAMISNLELIRLNIKGTFELKRDYENIKNNIARKTNCL